MFSKVQFFFKENYLFDFPDKSPNDNIISMPYLFLEEQY